MANPKTPASARASRTRASKKSTKKKTVKVSDQIEEDAPLAPPPTTREGREVTPVERRTRAARKKRATIPADDNADTISGTATHKTPTKAKKSNKGTKTSTTKTIGPASKSTSLVTISKEQKTPARAPRGRTRSASEDHPAQIKTRGTPGKSPVKDSEEQPQKKVKARKRRRSKKAKADPASEENDRDDENPPPQRSQKDPEKQIDVVVHRVRHLNHIPKGITRLAATPPLPSSTASVFASSYVAVGRDGGSIDLLAVDQKWRTVTSVAGLKNRDIDALAWICGGDGRNAAANNNISDISDGAATRAADADAFGVSYSCIEHEDSERIHSKRRLFGASRDGTIFEVDFATQTHIHVTPSGGGGVFCLQSLCPNQTFSTKQESGRYLAAGCEDGSVKIYRVTDDDSVEGMADSCLTLVSTLPSAGSAILTLAWRRGAGQKDSEGIRGSILYAGVADGTVRRYDCLASIASARESGSSAHAISTGSVLTGGAIEDQGSRRGSLRWRSTHRMTVDTLGRRNPPKVWAIQALSDGTVISGDSLGNVHFWDGHSGTLMSKFVQNENGADVLDLAVSANECKVFASGVDSRVICIEKVPRVLHADDAASLSSYPSESKWVQSQAQRPHTHDVKSLCICQMRDPIGAGGAGSNSISNKSSKQGRELLCSGGVDTKLCTYLVSKFRQHRAKKIFPWPSSSPVSVARSKQIIVILRSNKIDLYRLETDEAEPVNDRHVVDEDKTHIGSIIITSQHNLICADISEHGRFLATSDGRSLMLFALKYEFQERDGSSREFVIPTKIKLPKKQRSPCSAVKFAPGSYDRLYCATTLGPIHVLEISDSADGDSDDKDEDQAAAGVEVATDIAHTFDSHVGDGAHRYAMTDIALSPNGKWLATGRFGMGSGSVNVFAVPSSGDFKLWWSLPALEAPYSCIKFLGSKDSDDNALAIGCSNNCFYIFDHERRCLSDWSQDAGFPISTALPRELIHRAEYPVRIAFNASSPSKFLLVSFFSLSPVMYLSVNECKIVIKASARTTRCSLVNLATIFKSTFARPSKFLCSLVV